MQPGERLGPYEVLSPVGSGGMGEVWKARDTRLDRTVAIKHSAQRFSDRFEREAHAIAALNHPHICTLYDVGPDYLVMEFVDGKPLRGPLPLKAALEFGAQIADALHCAHSKGVVHRDLKPANILVTKSGVKLLDFGLAKMAAQPSTADATLTIAQPLTKDNTILGTLQYMSPEQLEGKPADARSDIFAFGLVLYEMICGKPAFHAESQASLIAAILKEEPASLASLDPVTPPALDRLVRKCLAKDPDARWQSATDLRDELEWIAQLGPQSGDTGTPVRHSRVRRWAVIGLASVAVVALVFAAGRLSSPPPTTTWVGTRLGGPEIAMGPRISPDGHTLAFQAMVGQNSQVAVMKPESGNWQVLTRKSDGGWVNGISWSPDGTRLYYDRFADLPLGVYSVPVLGGDEQLLLEDAFAPEPLPDGSLLVLKPNEERKYQVFRYWPDSGRLQGIPVELGVHDNVINGTLFRVSRDGKEAFAVGRRIGLTDPVRRLYVIDVHSGEVRRVQTGLRDDSAIKALAPSHDGSSVLAAVRSSDLVRVVVLPKSGSVAQRTLFSVTGSVNYLDIGTDGSIYSDQQLLSRLVLRFAREGGHAEKVVSLPLGNYGQMCVLPGDRIAFFSLVGDRSRLMTVEVGKNPVPLLNTNEETAPPLTAAGANEVAFLIGPESNRFIALASTANGRITQRIRLDKGPIGSLAASPDGKTLYCAAGGTVWSVPRAGEPRKLCAGDQVAVEPGGQNLLVKVIETPRVRLIRVPLNGAPPREIPFAGPWRLTPYPLESAGITKDGRMIAQLASLDSWYFVPGLIDLETGKTTRIAVDFLGDYLSLAWTSGGWIVAEVNEFRSSLWRFRPEGR
jgi:eukaryotic-like serine/threonine-protein kinase